MIRACGIGDLALVDRVMTDPSVYPYATYDGRESAEQYSAEGLLRKGPPWYVLMDSTNSFVAVFVPETNAMWIVHTNTLPSIRGKQAFEIARQMATWMFENTSCQNIVGYTPSRNRRALMFNRIVGFRKIGEVKNGIIKDGQLDDLHIVSLVKGEM
jgi:hypothetical protein